MARLPTITPEDEMTYRRVEYSFNACRLADVLQESGYDVSCMEQEVSDNLAEDYTDRCRDIDYSDYNETIYDIADDLVASLPQPKTKVVFA